MEYGFEIRKSDRSGKHWIIIKRDDKTDGFCMDKSDMNKLKVAIQNYLDGDSIQENTKE
jgi:hypothetical protein